MRLQLPAIDSTDGPLEFLIGIICNQAIRAEVAWRAASGLRDRLGHLDAWQLAAMHETELAQIISQRSALHPFATTMGKHIVGSCRLLVERYDGRVAGLWEDRPTATGLIDRLVTMPGIGKHKAEVALFLLVYQYGIPVLEDRPLDTALSHCARLRDFFGYD